jgi:hypothetical protein
MYELKLDLTYSSKTSTIYVSNITNQSDSVIFYETLGGIEVHRKKDS